MKPQFLQFYGHVLPTLGTKSLVTKEKEGQFFKHHPVSSIEELAALTELFDGKQQDVYFACATYQQGFYKDELGKTKFRTSENAGWVKSFWMDIDCDRAKADQGKGYLDVTQALKALEEFCLSTGLPLPTIVFSGGGVHCYFVLDHEITKDEWLPVAKKLKTLTHHHRLLADDSRTGDIASILRPVGTHNWKPSRMGKEVELHHLSKLIPFETFTQLIDDAYQVCASCEVEFKNQSKRDFLETEENIKRVKVALHLLDPNCDRALWRDICFALHSLGWECSKDLAKSWSRGDLL